jgi:hypothetical protein
MPGGAKTRIAGILFARIPPVMLLCIVLCVVLALLFPLFWPALGSLVEWHNHRDAVFEGESIRVPFGWVAEASNHLLDLEKPGLTLFSGPGSQISIDPFAERHQSNLPLARKLWLAGMKDDGQLEDPRTGSPVSGLSDLQCAQSEIAADRNVPVRVTCLSSDSLLEFDYWGDEGDFPAFRSVCLQTMAIARRHPGTVRPK